VHGEIGELALRVLQQFSAFSVLNLSATAASGSISRSMSAATLISLRYAYVFASGRYAPAAFCGASVRVQSIHPMAFKSGFVAIVGRPNAGKSTLVNTLVGQKVAIVSPKPQTTRNRIQGILNREDAQIVLVDTPGIHRPENVLSRMMMDELQHALEGIDVLCLIADATVDFGAGDRFAIEWVQRFRGPVYLLLNKVDRVSKALLLPMIERYNKEFAFAETFPISAISGAGCLDLVESWLSRLPEAPPHFPPDQFTDQPERFLAAEVVREKAIFATRDEVPHAIAVLVDSYEETPKILRIRATIYVEREGQKGILIGKGGEVIKTIGTAARKELEKMLGSKIFLELFVKVQPNWRQNSNIVRQLDWHRQLEDLGKWQEMAAGDSEE
jgi:GTP-binding protein Era